MSTKQDIIINSETWYNLKDLANITNNNKIIIQNKGNSEVLISYNNTPASSSREGFILTYAQFVNTDAEYVFVKSLAIAATLYVEEVI